MNHNEYDSLHTYFINWVQYKIIEHAAMIMSSSITLIITSTQVLAKHKKHTQVLYMDLFKAGR